MIGLLSPPHALPQSPLAVSNSAGKFVISGFRAYISGKLGAWEKGPCPF